MIIPISTKTGDAGMSGLASGERLSKSELIFEVLGTQDELNSWLGFMIVELPSGFEDHAAFLVEVQNALFYMGAELAHSPTAKLSAESLQKLESQSESLQKTMGTDWTTKFLFPGGNKAAAITDIARTVARRFERLIVRYHQITPVSPTVFQYANRLSDYLFVLRCFINFKTKVKEKKFESGGKKK